MKVVNLTQHNPTAAQMDAGVLTRDQYQESEMKQLLTFASIPDRVEIGYRVNAIVRIAKESGCEAAMIGGAPYLMGPLEKGLRFARITPLYSFTERKSIEIEKDGVVSKSVVFEHIGWVESAAI